MMTTHDDGPRDHDGPVPPPGFFEEFERADNVRPHPAALDRLPPNDIDAERALVAVMLCTSSTSAVRRDAQPFHFYLDAHRQIYTAILALEAEGRTPDLLTVRGYLEDRGALQRVGGTQALVDMLSVPTASNPAEYSRRVVDKWTLRQTIDVARRIAAEGYSATDPGPFVADARRLLESVEVQSRGGLEVMPKGRLFAPLPPVPWIVPDLYLAPGRPTMIAGYGYSAKSVAVQSLLLAVASGRYVWGRYRVQRPGRCLHIDHEQGERATSLRYQRLARAMGITGQEAVDVDELLDVSVLPRSFRLSNPDAADVLEQACDGVALCAIDSLHASTPGVDENEAGISDHITKLLDVSDRTGCAFIFVHHAGKGAKDKDAKERSRGNSSIYAACGCVLNFDGKVNEDGSSDITVSMVKAPAEAAGSTIQPFVLHVDDVLSEEGQERWGLECRQMTLEQIDPPVSAKAAREDYARRILEALRRDPGMSGRELSAAISARRVDVLSTLDYLQRTGQVVKSRRQGRGGGDAWSLTDGRGEEQSEDGQ
jgi:hypothetical protein